MTSNELAIKYEDACKKVEKRLNTIRKISAKVGVNADELIKAYKDFAGEYRFEYLPHRDADNIVGRFVSKKEERDADGHYIEAACEFNDKVVLLGENLCKLYEVERVAMNWKVKYDTQKNKEDMPKIQILVEFLDNWETMARDWYLKNADKYVEVLNKYHDIAYAYIQDNYPNHESITWDERKKVADEFNEGIKEKVNQPYLKPAYRGSTIDERDYARLYNIDSLTKELSRVTFVREGEYNYSQLFGDLAEKGKHVLREFDIERLNKILAHEKMAKYFDLCNRISDVVGEITDIQNLRIASNGNLDGVVTGTKGKAKVETIGAGGYNIQCFHYRVLVHKVK